MGKKKITIDRGNRKIVAFVRPVVEYKMDHLKKGLQEVSLNTMPFYFSSEEDLFSYLKDCGEKFTVEDAEEWE